MICNKVKMNHVGYILIFFFLAVRTAIAGTGGTEFVQFYDLLEGWTTGMLGKSIALAAFLVGIGGSIVRQTVIPIATGIGIAAAVAYTPEVLNGIITGLIF